MNEKTIWDKLIASGMTKAGTAGLMGNLYAESALNPKNLQQTYEKSLGYTDDSYTSAVDSGKYTNFVRDCAGYGLAQWTFWTRKQALLNYANDNGVSVGDLNMQVAFLIKELKTGYSAVWKILCTASDVKTASDAVMCQYECPADVSASARSKRAGFGQKYYDMFVNAEVTADKSVQELAQEVLENKWGTGADRKSRLTSAGYDYQAVQSAVNALLASADKSQLTDAPAVSPVEKSAETAPTTDRKSIDIQVLVDGVQYSGTVYQD